MKITGKDGEAKEKSKQKILVYQKTDMFLRIRQERKKEIKETADSYLAWTRWLNKVAEGEGKS